MGEEVDSIKHCEKRLTHTSELDFEVSESSIWKHTTSCDKGVFSSIVISQLLRPILSSHFHRFVIVSICWDIPSEKTGLWQLPIDIVECL